MARRGLGTSRKGPVVSKGPALGSYAAAAGDRFAMSKRASIVRGDTSSAEKQRKRGSLGAGKACVGVWWRVGTGARPVSEARGRPAHPARGRAQSQPCSCSGVGPCRPSRPSSGTRLRLPLPTGCRVSSPAAHCA